MTTSYKQALQKRSRSLFCSIPLSFNLMVPNTTYVKEKIACNTKVLGTFLFASLFSNALHAEWEQFGAYHWYERTYIYTDPADRLPYIHSLCEQTLINKKNNTALKYYPTRCHEEDDESSNSNGKKVVLQYDYDICVGGAQREILGNNCTTPNPPHTASPENIGGSPNNTCNPINIYSGNKYYKVNDNVTGNGSWFYRYYNSYNKKWSFDYTQRLIIADYENKIEVRRPDGKQLSFTSNADYSILTGSSHYKEKLNYSDSVFTLTLANNTEETYDANGSLLSIKRPNDNPILLTYSDDLVIVSYNNTELVLTVDVTSNQVTRVEFSSDAIDYTYTDHSPWPLLSTVTFPGGTEINYLYENTRFTSFITGVEDQNGNRISSVVYDVFGRATSSEVGVVGSGIKRTQIQYNDDDTRTVTSTLGKQNIYHFTQFGSEQKMTYIEGLASDNCASSNKLYTYDVNGFLASKTDWAGNVTTYVHNTLGQETSRTEAHNTPQARTILTEWHDTLSLKTKIIEPERTTVYTYDDQGRLTNTQIQSNN